MGIIDALQGPNNPISRTSREGRKMEAAALKWAQHKCRLNTTYWTYDTIADRFAADYAWSNPDGKVWVSWVFVKKTRFTGIPKTEYGYKATSLYYAKMGEIYDKEPKHGVLSEKDTAAWKIRRKGWLEKMLYTDKD
jgi:hypothetical protein